MYIISFTRHTELKEKTFLPLLKNERLMHIQLIETGFFYADGGTMFGAIPKTAWSRRYPADAQNGCVLTMRVALIHTDDGRIILIDNGAGDKQLKQLSYYRFFDLRDLGEELRQRGVSREEVTDVVLTHLHFDHCGYTTYRHTAPDGTQTLRPSFPRATHWVGRAQWENFLHPHALKDGDDLGPALVDQLLEERLPSFHNYFEWETLTVWQNAAAKCASLLTKGVAVNARVC